MTFGAAEVIHSRLEALESIRAIRAGLLAYPKLSVYTRLLRQIKHQSSLLCSQVILSC